MELVEEVRAVGCMADDVGIDDGTEVGVDGREVLHVGIRSEDTDWQYIMTWMN